VPPKYPKKAVVWLEQGLVLLRVDYDADGHYVSASQVKDSPKVDSLLVESALEAVTQWTFDPEIVGGRAIAGAVVVPICYSVKKSKGRKLPAPDCVWTPPGGLPSRLPIGESETPAARLVTNVIGREL